MRVVYAIYILVVIGLLSSCSDSETVSPTELELNPFTNGSSERNLVLLISDIHLGADLNYAEINSNLPYLEKFLEKVRVSPNVKELVLNGDILDEWFVPADVNTYNGKGQLDFVQRVASANKGVVDLFNKIIQEGKIKVTYLPGNHDLGIIDANIAAIFPGINQARDDVQGLGTYSPEGLSKIVIEHGHRYNFYVAPDPISNRDIAPGSIQPPGYFFTRIAAQHVIQDCKTAADSFPAITSNPSGGESQDLAFTYWKVWKAILNTLPIENKFDEKIIVTGIDGFTEKYSVNDIVPYQSASGEIDMKLYHGVQDNWKQRQTINKVAIDVSAAQAIAYGALTSQTDIQAPAQYFLNPNSDKRVVIFGHTHAAKLEASENYKGEKSIYANTGTWIDKNLQGPTRMNFVMITPQNSGSTSQTHIRVFNYEGAVFNEMAADSLRF
jgi:UDP-2,3-diacylglucosamine pyrophosphatase LpxH